MELTIEATGDALRFFAPNAAALGIDEPDRVGPDPVLLWLRCIDAGFADNGPDDAPRLALLATEFDRQRNRQRWHLEANNLDRGQLRIARNLLLARDVATVSMYTAEDPTPLPLHALAFPAVTAAAGVAWDYALPDADDIVRHRSLRIELAQAPDATLARRLTEELNLWIEVVCRSGWCPADEAPANAGAMPNFASLLDSHTLAVDFDGIFRVDEACFDAIAAYTHRLYGQGIAVAAVAVR